MAWQNLQIDAFMKTLRKSTDAVLIDVRTAEECAHGFIENSLHLDIRREDILEQLAKISIDKSVFVYCEHGIRSSQVCRYLHSKAYPKLYNLIGGYDAFRKSEIK